MEFIIKIRSELSITILEKKIQNYSIQGGPGGFEKSGKSGQNFFLDFSNPLYLPWSRSATTTTVRVVALLLFWPSIVQLLSKMFADWFQVHEIAETWKFAKNENLKNLTSAGTLSHFIVAAACLAKVCNWALWRLKMDLFEKGKINFNPSLSSALIASPPNQRSFIASWAFSASSSLRNKS